LDCRSNYAYNERVEKGGFWNKLCPPEDQLDVEYSMGSAVKVLVSCRLSASLAIWAVRCSLDFISQFYGKMLIQDYKVLVDTREEELSRN
jgi:hypothetical protein